MSRDSISRLERGDPGVSLGVLLKVCAALGLPPLDVADPLATDAGRAAAHTPPDHGPSTDGMSDAPLLRRARDHLHFLSAEMRSTGAVRIRVPLP